MQFEHVYSDAALMRTADKYPSSILAFGDNGAEAYGYVRGTCAHRIGTALGLYGSRLSAVFISGGGNDFAGINDPRPLLADNCVGCATAADCFREGSEKGSLDWLLARKYATALSRSSTRSSARPGRLPERPPFGIKQHDMRPGRGHDHSAPLRE